MMLVSIKVEKDKVLYFNPNKLSLKQGDKVIIFSDKRERIVEVISDPKEIDERKLPYKVGRVLRVATQQDIKEVEQLEKRKREIIQMSNDLKNKHKLDMKFVDVEYGPEANKITISFVCEDRVDFRELVKDLATELKLRIELKQIGVRDQAKSIGALGPCGKECCCKQYLNDFDKVSIKMAKTQGLSLNPTKISGVCGRLMCCLGYENEYYSEMNALMPRLNSTVTTPDGEGTVIYNAILKQKVTVRISKDDSVKVNEYELRDITFKKRDNPPHSGGKNCPKHAHEKKRGEKTNG